MTIRTSSSSKHRKNPNKGRARLKFGGGYKGLAMAIVNINGKFQKSRVLCIG